MKDKTVLLSLGLLKVALHIPFFNNYGYFRDELYYIACSNHLAWGYVDQPPLSLFILACVRFLFGDSLIAIRFITAVAGAVTVYLTGLTAREIGGGKFAVFLAALAAFAAPVYLGNAGRYFSMNAFDILFWALTIWLFVRIVKGGPGWLWILFGVSAGLGMLNKYSIGFLLFGLFVGMLLTPERKHLWGKWFWLGAAVGGLIFLPHVVWEVHNGFPTLEFMHNATTLKNTPTPPLEFFHGQLDDVGLANALLWIPGMVFLLFHPRGKPFRHFAFMYAAIFIVMVMQNAKVYYLSPAYPPLLAAGAVFYETLRAGRIWIRTTIVGMVILLGLVALPFAVPVLPVDDFIQYSRRLGVTPRQEERSSLGALPQYYADMFGWEEMVDIVEIGYRQLPADEQPGCLIYARNYGEAAAVDFFGKSRGLPPAASTHNSYWYWPPAQWDGKAAIIFASRTDSIASRRDLEQFFGEVRLVGITHNRYAMPFETGRPIFLCRKGRISIKELWARDKIFI
jgi:hypothetical protein